VGDRVYYYVHWVEKQEMNNFQPLYMCLWEGNGWKYLSFIKREKCHSYSPMRLIYTSVSALLIRHILRPFPHLFSLPFVSATYAIIALTSHQQNCILYPLQSPPSFVSDEPHLGLSPQQTRRPFVHL